MLEIKKIQMLKTDLEKKYPLIDFGKDFNDSKKELYAFNDATAKLNTLVCDPDYYISEHFLKLRSQIDLERELSKEQIDDHFDKLIQQLNDLEKEYKSDKLNNEYEDIIKQFASDLKRLNDEINIPKFDPSKWNLIKSEALTKKEDINLILENYKIELLKDQKLEIDYIQEELKKIFEINIIKKDPVCFIYIRCA